MTKLIIDTDPGIDDSLAIQFAFASKEFEILGLTSVFGNVDISLTTANALALASPTPETEIPVAQGASKPLTGNFSGGVPFIHGDDGQGNTWKAPGPQSASNIAADEFIVKQVNKFPGQITLAALGPLTNLAMALQRDPQIQYKVKEVVLMGGNAFCGGNATPAAEANMLSDPEAADLVFGAAWPTTMVGLDVTHKILLSRKIFEEIATYSSPINDHVTAGYLFYLDFFKRVNKIDGTYLHDASVFAYLLDKSLFGTVSYPIRVETNDGISKGKTWPAVGDTDNEEREALQPWKSRPKINICVEVDGEKVVQLLRQRLMN